LKARRLASLFQCAKAGDAIWDPEAELIFQICEGAITPAAAIGVQVTIAYDRHTPVGFAIVKCFSREQWILEVYVLTAYRNMRIASALFEQILRRASEQHCPWLLCELATHKHASRALVRAQGYKRAGTLRYDGAVHEVEYWRRRVPTLTERRRRV
jgi:GNAT superfamily N-acetyltransferase